MSTATAQPRENAASRASRKQRKVLIVLAGVTLLTWGRHLLSKDDDKTVAAPAAAPASGAVAPGAKARATAAAASRTKAILTFEQAQERMKLWPEALNRRVIQGHIEDLSPGNWQITPSIASVSLQSPSEPAVARSAPEAADIQAPPIEQVPTLGTLPLRLRSTVIFGQQRYAVIEGVRYAQGDTVEIKGGPASGLYLLQEVRPREVVLRQGDNAWTVIIQEQAIRSGGSNEDAAE